MSTFTLLYIILQLDAIIGFLNGVHFLLILTAVLSTIGYIIWFSMASFDTVIHPPKQLLYITLISTIFATLLGLIIAATPTTERAALMVVGAKVIDSNTTHILSNIPEKYAKILEQKADAYMKELEKQQ